MTEYIALIGSLCFAFCSWPLAYSCVKNKTAKGIDWSMILLHLTGATFSSSYAIGTMQWVLLPNYLSGGFGMFIVFLYKARDMRRAHG